ncbi:MAG: hypothetical protein GKR87_01035 [Kiritimatiellae bacterium]|nr:hypothetical protein [Kiritimatiellia bacterium]
MYLGHFAGPHARCAIRCGAISPLVGADCIYTEQLEDVNKPQRYARFANKIPFPFQHRDWIVLIAYDRIQPDELVVTMEGAPDYQPRQKASHPDSLHNLPLEDQGPEPKTNSCHIRLNPGGWLPA